MATPVATVIIPNYNGMTFLPRLLESLTRQSEPRWEAIVVDDASTDEGAAYVRDAWSGVQLIRHPKNRGFAASCNSGLQVARTPFVVLLNNDTHVAPDWLAEGLRPFEHRDVGAAASLVLLAESPHLIDTAGDLYSVVGGAVKRAHLQPKETADRLEETIFSPSGASAFYRREALSSVGFLDARFESYYEDVDLGFRLAWAGYRCVFAPRSVCYHHLSASYHPKGWRYHFNSARNAEIVWWSNMPRGLLWRRLPAHAAFLCLQAANKLRQGCLSPYLAGKWAAMRCGGWIRRKRRQIRKLARVSEEAVAGRLVRDWRTLHLGARMRRTREPSSL